MSVSAKEQLQAMPAYMADGGEAMSEGLATALAPGGIGADAYYANISRYMSTHTDPLKALEEAARAGISLADAAKAVGQQRLNEYLNVNLNTETLPTVAPSGYTSELQTQWLGQAPDAAAAAQESLNARIRQVAAQYAGNPTELQNRFIANQVNVDDLIRAGVDPLILLSVTPKTVPKPVVPVPGAAPTMPPAYPLPPVYQPLPEPPPIYAPGQPALDQEFRNSAPRSEFDPVYGYSYTPAAKLRSATGSGMSWTPPSVTSRPRDLLRVPLSTTSASQQYARDISAQDRALYSAFANSGLPQNASNFYSWRNRLRGGEFGGGQGAPLNLDAFNLSFDTWAKDQAAKQAIAAQGATTPMEGAVPTYNLRPYAHGGYVTKKAEGGPVEAPPAAPSRSTSADQYEDVFKDIPLMSRIGEYLGGAMDRAKYGLRETGDHVLYQDTLRRRFGELYPQLKTDKQDNGLLDAAVKYAGAYDWAVRPEVAPEDARSMAHAYQLYDYNRSNRNPQDEVSDYVRNMAGVEEGIKHRAEGRRLNDEELFRAALDYAVSQTGGTMPLGKVDLWLREANKGITPAVEEQPVKKKDGGEVRAQLDRIGSAPNAKTPEPRPTKEQTESARMLERLQGSSPLERKVYELTGMEPGLDRAGILPIAGSREAGNLQFAAPEVLYSLAKTAVAPSVALEGNKISEADTAEAAMNVMGGGLGISNIAGPEAAAGLLGMAVKAKGGVFRPSVGDELGGLPLTVSGMDTVLTRYADQLKQQGIPEESIPPILDKARRYFTTSYGTAEDPMRLAILEGRLNPQYFRDYLLTAAQKDYAARQAYKKRIAAGEINADEAPWIVPQSLEDFERTYDRGTGLRGTVYTDDNGYTGPEMAVLEQPTRQMQEAGVPEELINSEVTRTSPTEILNTPYSYQKKEIPFIQAMQSGVDPLLSRALQNKDVIYDINGIDLPFLSPSTLAQGIAAIPPTLRERMSFPEMATRGAQMLEKDQGYLAAVERARKNRPIPKRYFMEGVEKVIDAGPSAQWVRITDPKYTLLEGAAMGHSVGDYAKPGSYGLGGKEAFEQGKAHVYSLRNTKTGKPSITIEVQAFPSGQLNVKQIKGLKNSEPTDKESIFRFFDAKNISPSMLPTFEFYNVDSMGERLGEPVRRNWSELYSDYLNNKITDNAPVKKAKGGSVERVYNDRKFI